MSNNRINRELLYKLYMKHGNWRKATEEYNSVTGENRTEHTLRTSGNRHINKNGLPRPKETKNKSVTNTQNAPVVPGRKLEIKSDGTHSLIAYSKMTFEQTKEPEYVMRVNGYPPEKWELHDLIINEYGSTTNEDNQYYQIKFNVKPKTLKGINYEDVNRLIKREVKRVKPIKYKKVNSDKSFALFITDKHIGLSLENDYLLKSVIEQARQTAIEEEVEKIYVYNLGDFFHVDNASKTTNRGTQMDMPISAYEMWDRGLELTNYIVDRLSFIPLEFTWVQGNHSRLAEYSVMNAIKHMYSNNKHIIFNVDSTYRKANNIYETFIGCFHGDMPKKNYTHTFQYEFPELWGSCKYWESYSGHLHSKEVMVTTTGGLEHTILSTMKPTDDYEYSLGYGNYRPRVEAYIYEKGKGKTKTYYY